MASKKKRVKLKKIYEIAEAQKAALLEKTNRDKTATEIEVLLDRFNGKKVTFPEIAKYGDIKIGTYYTATIQIASEPEQSEVVIIATMKLNPDTALTYQARCLKHLLNSENNEQIEAINFKNDRALVANPILSVLFRDTLSRHTMMPMRYFRWYGKSDILISDLVEYPKAQDLIHIPFKEGLPFVFSGYLNDTFSKA